jgi:phosphoribosylformylglycinamidine cyclo-ligase
MSAGEPKSNEHGAVNYSELDPFKIAAQRAAGGTAHNLRYFGYEEMIESRGESAYVWDEGEKYGAATPEGLGTKNLVADRMRQLTGRSNYDNVAQDTVAMIVNDIITVGALPKVVLSHWSVAESAWFNDTERANDLIRGWAEACNLAGATWGSGETPALKGILMPGTIELSGSAVGEIYPKDRYMKGDNVQPGDEIILLESSGIHANGLTDAREVSEKLPFNFATPLGDGRMYGEALLEPTPIYVDSLLSLFRAGLSPHYAVNMTGHGWRKLMRANKQLSYVIEQIPDPQPEFHMIQGYAGKTDEEMYRIFNMGAGFAYFVAAEQADFALEQIEAAGYRAIRAGYVKEGPKQVIIEPKGIIFGADSLNIR